MIKMDKRISKLAKILVDYSTEVRDGDYVQIVTSGTKCRDLALEVYKLTLQRGAYPKLHVGLEGEAYTFYKYASEKHLRWFPRIDFEEMKKTDVLIYIGSDLNTKELSNIDPKKISLRQKTMEPILNERLKKRWVGTRFPTSAYAQDAGMSLEEFEDFYYEACLVDWERESKKQDKLKRILDKGKEVRITGEETDLTFSIRDREAIKWDGKYNMPDGEVCIAPVETTAEGEIYYDLPAILGREVNGIRLKFEHGEIVKATAEKGEDFLLKMLKTDDGAKRLGEFGIGTNYKIKKFVKNILFDEKIGGTIHLAVGLAYEEGGGKNKSAIHWDMIKDMRKGGEIIVDGKIIQKSGKFVI
jgi:aminopeptidase